MWTVADNDFKFVIHTKFVVLFRLDFSRHVSHQPSGVNFTFHLNHISPLCNIVLLLYTVICPSNNRDSLGHQNHAAHTKADTNTTLWALTSLFCTNSSFNHSSILKTISYFYLNLSRGIYLEKFPMSYLKCTQYPYTSTRELPVQSLASTVGHWAGR